MTQNRSHAVMAQRAEPHDSLDYFPTPPWATRALLNWIEGNHGCLDELTAWEPACGRYHMVRPMRAYFAHVSASDVHPYGTHPVHDFLMPGEPPVKPDWIITNPPFRLAEAFAHRALAIAAKGAALLVRTVFLEGGARWRGLYSKVPPTDILLFSERVPMLKGRLEKSASSATSYAWFVWRRGVTLDLPPGLHWIPPGTRKACERADDYALPAESESYTSVDAHPTG